MPHIFQFRPSPQDDKQTVISFRVDNPCPTIYDMLTTFKSYLLACGWHPDNVRDVLKCEDCAEFEAEDSPPWDDMTYRLAHEDIPEEDDED